MRANSGMVSWLCSAGFADNRVADAMSAVDRGLFVPEGERGFAYEDRPLPIGKNQTISAPSIVALMSRELKVQEGMRVLEIGTGSGYQTAILAFLAGKEGKVYSVERIAELSEQARGNIAKLPGKVRGKMGAIEFFVSDGHMGLEKFAPYDRIIVTAAAGEIPNELKRQLAKNGRMLIPVGAGWGQELILYEKGREEKMLPVIFVPLVRDE